MELIRSHRELKVYQLSFEAGMEIFHWSKSFPKEERYSLTDQIRRSSGSVSTNISEAFRKRPYPTKSFIAKSSAPEGKAAETQNCLDLALACAYIGKTEHRSLYDKYDHILSMIVNMINNPGQWSL